MVLACSVALQGAFGWEGPLQHEIKRGSAAGKQLNQKLPDY